MATAMACREAEEKAWTLGSTGTEGFLGQRQEVKNHQQQALVLDRCSRELSSLLGLLHHLQGCPKALCTTKICKLILPEFVTNKVICVT